MVRSVLMAVGVVAATVPLIGQPPGSVGCQSDIVSATVVATTCSHVERETQVLDLLVLWRSRPDWFQPADLNLALAQRARDVRDYLQCEVPMPRPEGRVMTAPLRVVTVCEKLRRLR